MGPEVFSFQDILEQQSEDYEVLLKVAGIGICSSDMYVFGAIINAGRRHKFLVHEVGGTIA